MIYFNNKKFRFYFYITIYPFIFLIAFLLYTINCQLDYMIGGFILCFLWTLIYCIIRFGLLSLYSIFLYTSAFFIYNCFPMTLFGNKNFLIQTFPKKYSFDESIGLIFIICCYISVYFVHIGYLIKGKKQPVGKVLISYENNKLYEKFGILLMLLFFIPLIYKTSIQLKAVIQYGYAAIYTGLLGKLSYPFWTIGSSLFFNSGYYIFLASKPSPKKFLLFSMLLLCTSLFSSMKGGRGDFLALLLSIIYYYSRVYKVKIQFHKLILVIVFIISFTIILGNIRTGYGNKNKEKNEEKDISLLVESALWSQTTTRAVPMLIIKDNLRYHSYPFFFYPITSIFNHLIYKVPEASQFGLEHFNNPSLVLISNISKKSGLNGFGYDSAFLGEAYEFGGYIGITFFSLLLGFFLAMFDFSNFLKIKNELVPIFFILILTIPRLPRKPILCSFDYLNTLIIVYFLLFFINVFFKKRFSNNPNDKGILN